MSGPAQVRSTPAIEALQAALASFEKRVQAALDTLDGELHRTEDWLEHDRPSHWRGQLYGAEDSLHQTKLDLERCLMMTVAGERPSCREQKAAVKAAQDRLAYCRDKGNTVKQWQRNFRHESLEYRGRVGQLKRALEHDLPRARAVLIKILRRIEEYQIERPPEASDLPIELSLPPAEPTGSNARRAEDDAADPPPDNDSDLTPGAAMHSARDEA
jgi:exonuclease VII large subunit